MVNLAPPPAVTADLLARYDRPGPRYTSYPTAPLMSPAVDAGTYATHLSAASAPALAGVPLSVYVHLPFCEHRCSFCACHAIQPRSPEAARPYLDRVRAEIEMVAGRLGDRRRVSQYHWGGGTPTYFAPTELRSLQRTFDACFERIDGAECSVETDPRVTTEAHVAELAALGFNRISIGVQDLDAGVQDAIGRHQTEEQVHALVDASRRHGFASVNLDLVYGLPGQTLETFDATLQGVVALAPDRLAVFSFAHLPDDRANQRRIDTAAIPPNAEKLEMFANAVGVLGRAGYEWVGMDHFARPTDDLVVARAERRLHRNFMGYTTARAPDLVGFGASAIGDVAGGYFQNHKLLRDYYAAVDAGLPATARGYVRSGDDDVRRFVIMSLMCNRGVDWGEVATRFDVAPLEVFAAELEALGREGTAELVAASPDGLALTDLGAMFPRNVARVFDRHDPASPTLGNGR